MVAVRLGDMPHATLLIQQKLVNIHANGGAALRAAAAASHVLMIDLLLKHGADMNQGLVEGGGAFLTACRDGNIPVVKQLSRLR